MTTTARVPRHPALAPFALAPPAVSVPPTLARRALLLSLVRPTMLTSFWNFRRNAAESTANFDAERAAECREVDDLVALLRVLTTCWQR